MRTVAFLFSLALSTGAFATSAVEVQRLASGTPVNLVTGNQLVTFTPSGTMTAAQIAQTLENVRQSLIARGIATPTVMTPQTPAPVATPPSTASIRTR
ncbi:MAG TPA: hypothetical protein VEU32_12130 [Burkholderiales bacterium]|nr:hypothetical protein [Burkholderiales bacterium]